MDDVRIGNIIRTIRIRKHLRQSDLARRAGVTRETVSRLERGGFGRHRFDDFLRVVAALGIRADVRLRWQGGDLDRVMNAAHASLHESMATYLSSRDGWVWRPEVSFSIYGERGVIDILAWHAATRSLLIIELKTELVDPQGLVATMHRRVRLGPKVAGQHGWDPLSVSAWVVISDGSTNRRRRRAHASLPAGVFPDDGRTVRRWLRSPRGPVSALSFWSRVGSGAVRRNVTGVKRVRADHAPHPAG